MVWVLYCEDVSALIHYLDDFLHFGPSGSNITAAARAQVEATFSCIGAPLAHHKTEGPTTALTFLGIKIDTDLLQLSLPANKAKRFAGAVAPQEIKEVLYLEGA